jgi:Zn-dependent protease with chaperone function
VRSRLRLPAALAATSVVAEAAVLLLRPRERFTSEPVEPREYFSAADLERARRFRRGQLALHGVQSALETALLVAVAARAPRAGRRPEATGAAVAGGLTLTTMAATLPLRAISRQRAKNVGLVTQSWGGWAVDVAKGTAIGATFSAAAGAALAAGVRRFGRGWWAPGAALSTAVGVVFSYLGPVVLDPLFNRFTPLAEGPTRDEVLDLARRAGVRVGEVYEVDASRRTTAANAYVAGLGATKRVVLFDTLLRDFTPAEIRLVLAHELAHVRHRDVARGLAFLALIAPVAAYVAADLGERLTPRGATPVPAVGLAMVVLGPPLSIAGYQLSRALERRADEFALRLTDEPDAAIALEQRLTLSNVADPAPPRWQRVLLSTHPPTVERIGQALAFRSRRSPAAA